MSGAAKGYVRTADASWAVQLPDDSAWGFSLLTDDQSFPGGFGLAESWELVAADQVPAEVRDELGWLLD